MSNTKEYKARYGVIYYEANKERLKAGMKRYFQENRARLKEIQIQRNLTNKANGTYKCEGCDMCFTTGQNLRKHNASKKHKKKVLDSAEHKWIYIKQMII